MEALVFRNELFRYLASRLTFGLSRRLWSARLCPLHHVHVEPPKVPGPGWSILRVTASGICGTDLNMVTGRESLFLQPEATLPFVPGHELVGRVERSARGVRAGRTVEVNAGDRVAVWPVLGCDARGCSPPCPSCAAGWEGLCRRRHDAAPGSGLSIGFDRETGGGWSEQCVAHVSQLWLLPDSVSDEDALLLDPASTALAALLCGGSEDPGQTLIIGGGTIGLLSALLHRQLRLCGDCELLVRHDFQRAWASDRGLNATAVRDERQFQAWAGQRSIPMTRVAGYGPVYRGHYDRVIDAAGSRSSLRWALRGVRPRGVVALVAADTDLSGIDPTPAWYRGLSIQGICPYGPVPWRGQWVHPYEVLIPAMADGTLRLRDLITHQFPLRDYVAAFDTALGRARSGAIKVVFRPTATRCNH
jgi:threonine dehydrogenase-like Zn-dependent dehydrogenase